MFRAFLYGAAASIVTAAFAQQPAQTTPGPARPARASTYDSAFEGYRSYREESAGDWRAVNDEVGRVGGHVGIVGGAAGHSGYGAAKRSSDAAEAGQPPVRGAPKAPGGAGRVGHH
ncbi:MAG TPA: hypothetical protein VED01_24625 [Burkholderiales bacterium]|nr:hypothetical protein [Burkholderiales bacterium]